MNLLPRVLSSAVLIAIVVLVLLLGGWPLDTFIAVAALIGAIELHGLLSRLEAVRPQLWLLAGLAIWTALRVDLPGGAGNLEYILLAAICAGLLVALITGTPFLSWAASAAGGLYVGLGLGSLLGIAHYRASGGGVNLIVIGTVVGAVIACDTLAYFTGFALGRHSFFTRVSPSKTVEGAVGGLGGAVAVATLVGIVKIGLAWWQAALLGILIGISAQGGDLAESALKRQAKTKDASHLIPGHGGVLDRLDSLLLVGPVVYCYLHLVAVP